MKDEESDIPSHGDRPKRSREVCFCWGAGYRGLEHVYRKPRDAGQNGGDDSFNVSFPFALKFHENSDPAISAVLCDPRLKYSTSLIGYTQKNTWMYQ